MSFTRFVATHAKMTSKRSNLAIYWHPACERHNIPSHPEQPGRVVSILQSLRENFPDASFRESLRVTDEQILNAHHPDLLQSLQRMFAEANERREADETVFVNIDSDTVIMHGTEEAVYRAAGAAVQAIDDLFAPSTAPDDAPSSSVDVAFCCVRPPGHHAEPLRSMGFCFVNNTVVAAEHARIKYGVQRVAILDFDVHHGNGTNEYARLLFQHYEQQRQQQTAGRPDETKPAASVFTGGFGAKKLQKPTHDFDQFAEILQNHRRYHRRCHPSAEDAPRPLYPLFYASTHEREGYPGTGPEKPKEKRTEVDRFVVNRNIPFGPESRDVFRAKWREIVEELARYEPELVVFSAGFDAHDDDPLSDVELSDEDFYWATAAVLDRLYEMRRLRQRETGESRPLRVLSVLEGGYDLAAIARCAVEHVAALVESRDTALAQDAADASVPAASIDKGDSFGGDEVAALQASLAEMGIQSAPPAPSVPALGTTTEGEMPTAAPSSAST